MNIRLTILLLLLPVLALGQPLSIQVFPYTPSGSEVMVWTDNFDAHSANVAVWANENWDKVDDSLAVIDVSGDKVVKSASSSRSCAGWGGGGDWTSNKSHYSQVVVETYGTYGSVGPTVCVDEDSANYYLFWWEAGVAKASIIVDHERVGWLDATIDMPAYGTAVRMSWIYPDTLRLYYDDVLETSFGTNGTVVNSTLSGGTTKRPGIGGGGQGETHYSNDWEGGYIE